MNKYVVSGKKGSKIRWKKQHSLIKIKNRLSKEKVAIMAYLSGDGYIKFRNKGFHYEIAFFLDEFILAKRLLKLFYKEFKIKPVIKRIKSKVKNGKGLFTVRISNKPACLHLLKYGTYGTLDWELPNNLNDKLAIEWIKCFFDCEAYVNLHKKQIQVKSVNGKGLNQVKERLFLLKINSKVYGPYDNGSNHNPYFLLSIHNSSDVKNYLRLLGFYHLRKLEDLRSLFKR